MLLGAQQERGRLLIMGETLGSSLATTKRKIKLELAWAVAKTISNSQEQWGWWYMPFNPSAPEAGTDR